MYEDLVKEKDGLASYDMSHNSFSYEMSHLWKRTRWHKANHGPKRMYTLSVSETTFFSTFLGSLNNTFVCQWNIAVDYSMISHITNNEFSNSLLMYY